MASAKFGKPISLVGIQGPQGIQGLPGTSVLAGNGAPDPALGQAGDIYVDLDAAALYAPKTDSGWPSATRSLVGLTGETGLKGETGTSLLSGYGAPADTLGHDGDSYFNTQNASIVGPKAGGKWPTSFTSLVGPSGSRGETGTLILAANGAPDDAQGSDGDFFVDTLDGRFYGPKADGAWGNGISLIGPQGSTGARGLQGLAGADGATILTGQGAPSDQGKPGDYYFDTAASMFYGPRTAANNQPWPATGFSLLGAQGPQGPQGPGGMMGADGKTLRSGIGDPADDFGDDGDFYFNADNGYLIGPKDGGKWPLPGFLLKGPQGDQGATGATGAIGPQGPGILAGAGAPDPQMGTDGAFYIDGQNYVLYGPKQEGAQNPWVTFRNIVGPQGPAGAASTVPGPQGPTGLQGFSVQSGEGAPPNSLGNDGDLYVDLAGPFLYAAKSGGAWPTTYTSLAGPAGPQGAASTVPGPQGLQGYSLLSGAGAPSATYGQDGDSYLDLNNGRLYGAKTNGAWPTDYTSIVGATGAKGDTGAAGTDGANGTILRYGMGGPTGATTANDGDFYIDQTASRLYGPRANGSWPSGSVSLVGPTGANGSLIVTGNGPPAAGTGSLGDIYIDLAAGNLYSNKTQSGWPGTYTSLLGPQGQAGSAIQTGQGAPAANLGRVGDIYVDVLNGFLYASKTASGWPATGTSLLGPAGPQGVAGATGPTGLSVLTGTGAPADTLGVAGQAYVQTDVPALYVKSASGWSAGVTLVGPAGSDATLPKDITGNSIILAPVSGSSTATQVTIQDNSGNTVFTATASGVSHAGGVSGASGTFAALQVNGSSTTTGSASVGGNSSATRFVATSAGAANNPLLQYTTNAAGTKYTSGVYSEPNFGQWYETVGGFLARAIRYVGTNPNDNGPKFCTHDFISGVTGGANPAHRFYVGTSTLALQIAGNGSASFSAALGVGGALTAAGIGLSSGGLTFPDGSTLTTAIAANPASLTVTSAGSAAAPAYKYAGGPNPAGTYFDALGNVLFSVNGSKSLYSTAAAGAAQGANGWAIASTLGAGQAVLSVTGSGGSVTVDGAGAVTASAASVSGAVNAGSVTSSGLTSTAGLQLASGAITFADGTTQSTAGGAGGTGGGSSAQYVASAAGSAGSPAFTSASESNTGTYFTGSGNGSAVQFTVNGSNVATVDGTGLVLPAGSISKITYADGTSQSTSAAPTVALGSYASSWGAPVNFNGQIVGTGQTVMNYAGTSIPSQFVATQGMAFTGLSATSYGMTGATIYFYLYDVTAGAIVYNYNSGNGIASGAVAAVGFPSTAYPLTAGHTYRWGGQRVAAGVGYLQVIPQYLTPSSSPAGTGTYNNFVIPSSVTLSSTAVNLQPPGIAGQTGYYRSAGASSLYSGTATVYGTGTATFAFVAGSSVLYTMPSITGSASGVSANFGPIGLSSGYITPGTNCYWQVSGSGTITAAQVSMVTLL